MCNFDKGYYEEQFREIIPNLDQWVQEGMYFKDISYGALVALWFRGAEPFVQNW